MTEQEKALAQLQQDLAAGRVKIQEGSWESVLDQAMAELDKYIHGQAVKFAKPGAGSADYKAPQTVYSTVYYGRMSMPAGMTIVGSGGHGGGGGSGGCVVATTKPSVCPKCFVSPEVDLHDTFGCAHGLRPARREEFVPAPEPAPAKPVLNERNGLMYYGDVQLTGGPLVTKPDTFNVGDYVRWDGDVADAAGKTIPHLKQDRWAEGDVVEVRGRWTDVRLVRSSDGRFASVPSFNGCLRRVPRPATGDVTSSYASAVTSPVVTREPTPPDPLDVEYDGVKLRSLIGRDQQNRRDDLYHQFPLSPAQRAAVSAHWSAQLRAKVEASAAAERERERNRVMLDTDEDMPWRTW